MKKRLLQFSSVLSLISFPDKNIFHATIESDESCSYQIFIADGDYSPHNTAMSTCRWRLLAKGNLYKGLNSIDKEIDWDDRNLFAYPTNFKKKIAGKFYNAYHFIHVMGLAELYNYTRREIYKEYAQLWYSYIKNWPSIPIYNDNSIMLIPYSENFDMRYNKHLNLK